MKQITFIQLVKFTHSPQFVEPLPERFLAHMGSLFTIGLARWLVVALQFLHAFPHSDHTVLQGQKFILSCIQMIKIGCSAARSELNVASFSALVRVALQLRLAFLEVEKTVAPSFGPVLVTLKVKKFDLCKALSPFESAWLNTRIAILPANFRINFAALLAFFLFIAGFASLHAAGHVARAWKHAPSSRLGLDRNKEHRNKSKSRELGSDHFENKDARSVRNLLLFGNMTTTKTHLIVRTGTFSVLARRQLRQYERKSERSSPIREG